MKNVIFVCDVVVALSLFLLAVFGSDVERGCAIIALVVLTKDFR